MIRLMSPVPGITGSLTVPPPGGTKLSVYRSADWPVQVPAGHIYHNLQGGCL